MNYKLLYKKPLIIKYINGVIYKLSLLYNKNLFIIHSNMYRHRI